MQSMQNYFHSVMLEKDQCIGCTDCIKRCPTEAIRVRNGKAVIINERCIDCGMCIRVCNNRAKKATTAPLSIIENYACKVALPAPSIYAQIKNNYDINTILTGIKRLGFDYVFEVARAAELVTYETKKILDNSSLKKPVISSACPAVMRLIAIRFPSLIDNILPIISPMEAAAIAAKDYLAGKGIKREDIGIFFISPCAAKCTNVRNPLGIEKSSVDGVISMQEVYLKLRHEVKKITRPEPLCQSSPEGMGWAVSGGESRGLSIGNSISVDGVENVIQILEEVENGQLEDVDFIEGLACIGGCIGGPLTIENAFVAKNNLRRAEDIARHYSKSQRSKPYITNPDMDLAFTKPLETSAALNLDNDTAVALKMFELQNKIFDTLPHIDCGSCGAPTCFALAEDIVKGAANEEDCIFMLREKIRQMAEEMVDISQKLPPSLNS